MILCNIHSLLDLAFYSGSNCQLFSKNTFKCHKETSLLLRWMYQLSYFQIDGTHSIADWSVSRNLIGWLRHRYNINLKVFLNTLGDAFVKFSSDLSICAAWALLSLSFSTNFSYFGPWGARGRRIKTELKIIFHFSLSPCFFHAF